MKSDTSLVLGSLVGLGALGGVVWYAQRRASAPLTGLGQTELTDLLAPIQSRIQADLGRFLQARQTLEQAQRRALTPDQQVTVSTLLADQTELEGEVSGTLGPIQAGTYSVDTVSAAAIFLGRMEYHLSRVDDFRKQLGGAAAGPAVALSWPTVVMWGGIAVGILGGATGNKVLIFGGGAVAAVAWWLR